MVLIVVAEWLVRLATGYLIVGVAFWVAFAWRGAARIDPHARDATTGFRLIILPGTALLWPLLAWRWALGASAPAEEWNAHRAAARRAVPGPEGPGLREQHLAPGTPAPGTLAPGTLTPWHRAPGAPAPGTPAPGTRHPGTRHLAPGTRHPAPGTRPTHRRLPRGGPS